MSRPQGHNAIGIILRQRKIPLTTAGIEPASFRFVAQYLNHCATAVPVYLFLWPICPRCQQLRPQAYTIQICYRTMSCKQPCFVDPRFIGQVSCVCVRLACSVTSLVLAPSGVKGYHTATKTTSVDLSLTQILIDYDLISVRFIVFF